MFRLLLICPLLLMALFGLPNKSICAADTLEERVTAAAALFDGAEDRFQSPDPQWFESTRQALHKETERVGLALESHGEDYAAAWKKHLRWPLLTSNLGEVSEIDVAELALVRRWLYSNRKGLEDPFFAELRKRADAHLDAAYTLSQRDLEAYFKKQVVVARRQIWALAAEPGDARAADLGRTLGWFQRTRQLSAETAATRALLSNSNAQVIVSKSLINRVIGLIAPEVRQSLPVSDRVSVPNSRLFGQPRTAIVHGTARTQGRLAVDLVANPAMADLLLVYNGDIESRCRAVIGPVTVAMKTLGPVRAVTPIQVSMQGVQLIATKAVPQVQTRVTGVSARREILRRIGERRAHQLESRQQMNSRASQKAATLLQQEMDDRVATAIDEIRTQLQEAQGKLDSFQDVLAPVVREGAAPRWEGIRSTTEGVTINVLSQRREQFGAAVLCPFTGSSDVQVRLHVSFFNNMLETIMAGKTFTDEYFMNYGKILQAELPPQLMVHARAVRWAVIAAKPRPLEITIPAPNHFRIQLRMQRVDIGEEQFTGPTIATMNYVLQKNEFDEYQMERQGEVELDSAMPAERQLFLRQKLDAFFAPVLNAGGVALPEGGTLGRLRDLQSSGVTADRDWLTMGIQVPTEVLEEILPIGNK